MQERKLKTQERIFYSALARFNAEGIAATSTREVSRGAGIAEGTLYRHFDSKEDLAWNLFRYHFNKFADALYNARHLSSGPSDAIDRYIQAFCTMVDETPEPFQYCMLAQHDFRDRVARDEGNPVVVMRNIVSDTMRARQIPQGDPEILSAMAVGALMQPAVQRLSGRLKNPMMSYSDTFIDTIWAILINRGSGEE